MSDAIDIARSVRAGSVSARAVVERILAAIPKIDRDLNAFTHVLRARAVADADAVDAAVASGIDPGPLAGVPFAVKDLFDVAGETTTAGSATRLDAPPATADAALVARLRNAGAVLVGTTNMDEFAYGFSTENARFGTTRNPHDTARLAGGSSGGSAVAVAAGLVPIALGSDTNGSIRVPASLCGVFGLRPTHDSLSMDGVFPFVERLDMVGAFARSIPDLRLAHAAMLGHPLDRQDSIVRVARLGGWFARNVDADLAEGIAEIARVLGGDAVIELPLAEAARSAAFLLTAIEGGRRHLPALRDAAMQFDPATRDRFIAGALTPVIPEAEWVATAFTAELSAALQRYDVLIAPAAPCVAPPIAATSIDLDGCQVSARANLGLHAQPLSLAGVPVLCVPMARAAGLPLGVQLIAARNREGLLLSVAERLQDAGVVACAPIPSGMRHAA